MRTGLDASLRSERKRVIKCLDIYETFLHDSTLKDPRLLMFCGGASQRDHQAKNMYLGLEHIKDREAETLQTSCTFLSSTGRLRR